MAGLYSQPLRVYLALGALALWGLMSGFSLPVSLFPAASQPIIGVEVNYGSLTPAQFFESIGRYMEPQLQSVRADRIGVRNLTAEYRSYEARFRLEFEWGADPEEARRSTENVAQAALAGQEETIRRSLQVYNWRQNTGFLAISFYSPLRSLDEVYETLNPLFTPLRSRVPDADSLGLYNPSSKEISVRLSPERLALHQISTQDVERALRQAVLALNGGSLRIGERDFQVALPRQALTAEDLALVRVSSLDRSPVLLKDVADVAVKLSEANLRKFKTSGVDSLILFATPKEGGNIKQMADDILREVKLLEPFWPSDIEYKVLINPSDFINESIASVLREVGLAAFLAVLVLFFFIGSFRNVATAALEIPLSLVMAFILMKLTGMNLNLVSLGGLALSAGMNVDASVVVLENIFRHFEKEKGVSSPRERLRIIIRAVNEVKMPVIAATIASLVVFAPLIFTRGLANSILGDLAKAVIFSHGLSAVVALILVPTIRLHLMNIWEHGNIGHGGSPAEGFLCKLEAFYRRTLESFLLSRKALMFVLVTVITGLPLLLFLLLPQLKKEVIGKPETDWLVISISAPTYGTIQQMDSEFQALEADVRKNFPEALYTFNEIHSPTSGVLLVRFPTRKKMDSITEKAQDLYRNTPTISYWIGAWNPSEFKIPEAPDFDLEVIGGTPEQRMIAAEDLMARFTDRGLFDNRETRPAVQRRQMISVEPLEPYSANMEVLSRFDFSHYLRTALEGTFVESLTDGTKVYPIYLRFPEDQLGALEELKALPYGFENRVVPLGALARFSIVPRPLEETRENLTPLIRITGKMNQNNRRQTPQHVSQAREIVEGYRQEMMNRQDVPAADLPGLNMPAPDRDLQQALNQLRWALAVAVLLIFLTMFLQLGDLVQSALVMVAIPLGFVGVIVSLYVFDSTLSLNSGLGTILLSGIAVANSILLVNFITQLFSQGESALRATIDASTARLRPILMTSMTTGLGMLPVALGLGEGGKILQPLGIAVCGGLFVSTTLTLYLVPALQYRWLSLKENRREKLRPVLSTLEWAKEPPEAHP